MAKVDEVYIELQKHLDKQAVGFPATQSGVELRILRELFNPEQASLALHLSNEPRSAQDICHDAKISNLSPEKVRDMLEEMVSAGAIRSIERNGTQFYFTMPLLVGIVEFHAHKATPQFSAAFGEYMKGEYGRAFNSTRVSQMRTIPVEASLQIPHHVAHYDQIREIINSTDGPIAVNRCMCREGANKRGKPCHVTSRSETCMAFGDMARQVLRAGLSREVTREEALKIASQNEKDGLVLQPANYQKLDFICSCCGCCCGVMTRIKTLPKPAEFWAHNFYAEVDTEKCTACGTCIEKCQMNAVTIDEQNGYSTINLDRCIGCGNCVAACPSEALKLVKKEKETAPPEDCIGLYKILAEKTA